MRPMILRLRCSRPWRRFRGKVGLSVGPCYAKFMVRRTRGLATLSTAIFAVGLVGCRVHEAKAVGEGAAVAARETTRGADGEADVGARATPRKQWATGQGADVGEPWTPPAPALGRLDAAATGRVFSARSSGP